MLAAQNIYPDLQAASSTLLERLEQLPGKYNFERLIWPDLTWFKHWWNIFRFPATTIRLIHRQCQPQVRTPMFFLNFKTKCFLISRHCFLAWNLNDLSIRIPWKNVIGIKKLIIVVSRIHKVCKNSY